MAAPKGTLTKPDDIPVTRNGMDTLPNLLSRLGDDVMHLLNSQLALFKVELKEEARTYTRAVAAIAVGAVIATIGFGLINVAIAFAISTLFASANLSQPATYALGFVITGVVYLIIGGIVVLAMKSRLAKQEIMPPMTVQELRKDKQWLKSEL
jgi:uncharacterized membrane protein YqjE